MNILFNQYSFNSRLLLVLILSTLLSFFNFEYNTIGIFLTILSIIFRAIETLIIENIMQDIQIDSLNLIYYSSPMILFILLPFLMFENLSFSINDGFEILTIILRGFVFFFEILAKFSIVKNFDALSLNLFSSIVVYIYLFKFIKIYNYISLILFGLSIYYYSRDNSKTLLTI